MVLDKVKQKVNNKARLKRIIKAIINHIKNNQEIYKHFNFKHFNFTFPNQKHNLKIMSIETEIDKQLKNLEDSGLYLNIDGVADQNEYTFPLSD